MMRLAGGTAELGWGNASLTGHMARESSAPIAAAPTRRHL